MAAKHQRFIVLVLVDRDDFGFGEETLPPLVSLMDAASPDKREFWHAGVRGFFLTSRDALSRVRTVIQQAEILRTGDSRFSSLGIGLAEGPMLADFTFFGRLKELLPIGSVVSGASRSAQLAGAYEQPLQTLWEEFSRSA